MSKRYCVDIDGTICTPTVGRDYHKAEPWKDRIKVLNKLYDEGNYIIYFTARAMGRFSDQTHFDAAESHFPQNENVKMEMNSFHSENEMSPDGWGPKMKVAK